MDEEERAALAELVAGIRDSGKKEKAMGDEQNAVKPGWKTTEFWLTFVTALTGFAYASGLITEGTTASKVAALVVVGLGMLGYNVSRAIAKK